MQDHWRMSEHVMLVGLFGVAVCAAACDVGGDSAVVAAAADLGHDLIHVEKAQAVYTEQCGGGAAGGGSDRGAGTSAAACCPRRSTRRAATTKRRSPISNRSRAFRSPPRRR